MLRIDPRDEADLFWFWNAATDEIAMVASTWPAEARARAEWIGRSEVLIRTSAQGGVTADVGLRCGPVHVGSGTPYSTPGGFDGRAVAAATKFKRISRALEDAGPRAELVLRLRFREVLQVGRIPFGCSGAGEGARTGRKGAVSIGRVLTPLRGPGATAHLTKAVLEAYAAARSTLAIGPWTDRLGQRLGAGKASALERAMLPTIRREAEMLVLWAWGLYRVARRHVPELVKRRARLV